MIIIRVIRIIVMMIAMIMVMISGKEKRGPSKGGLLNNIHVFLSNRSVIYTYY